MCMCIYRTNRTTFPTISYFSMSSPLSATTPTVHHSFQVCLNKRVHSVHNWTSLRWNNWAFVTIVAFIDMNSSVVIEYDAQFDEQKTRQMCHEFHVMSLVSKFKRLSSNCSIGDCVCACVCKTKTKLNGPRKRSFSKDVEQKSDNCHTFFFVSIVFVWQRSCCIFQFQLVFFPPTPTL